MTDEERQKLVAKLRWYGDRMERELSSPMKEAADEIERLATLAQSDAEPVAWQYRVKQGGWGGWHDAVPSREEAELCVELGRKASGGHLDDYEIRPLYAAPPRPDTSAGLIEAAEWHEQEALRFAASPYTSDKMRGMMHKEDARKLRARAADRNME